MVSQEKTQTVLLVDDEVTVRNVGARMLSRLGYDVLTAEDGVKALEVFRAQANIDCVLLDLTMPRMDGAEALRELRELDPQIPVILSSGFSEEELSEEFDSYSRLDFLQKPFDFKDLTSKIRSVLG